MTEDPAALVPYVPEHRTDAEPSTAVREELAASAKRAGIDRASLLGQIGSGVPMSPQQRKNLMRQATDEIVSLLPTGEVYVEGAYWRKVLNEVFGPLQWGVLSVSEPVLELAPPDTKGVKSMLFVEVFVIIKGVCVGCAIGAQEYFPGSKRMTKDDALEGCRTNGVMRVMKQFGVYGNLWESKWANPCRDRIGLKVRMDRDSWPPTQWRRIDSKPLKGEQGLAPDSPNKEHYQQPVKPTPPPVVEKPAPPVQTAPTPAETRSTEEGPAAKILVIRKVSFLNTHKEPPAPDHYWVVNTDHDEYITNDELMHKALEAARSRNQRIVVTMSESISSSKGTRKRLLEYRLVEKE